MYIPSFELFTCLFVIMAVGCVKGGRGPLDATSQGGVALTHPVATHRGSQKNFVYPTVVGGEITLIIEECVFIKKT
jgi:hypothetical protein